MTSAAMLKKSDPVAYFDNFLLSGCVPDGRSSDVYGTIRIIPGTNWKKERSVVVEHGNVVVSITGRLILQRQNDSPSVVFKLESSDKSLETKLSMIKSTLKQLVRQDVFFAKDQLNTEEDALRFQLRFTITIFSADGFIMDAVLTGINALLLQIRIPVIEYNWLKSLEQDEQQIDVARIKVVHEKHRKLELREIPVYSAFVLYIPRGHNKPLLVADPPSDMISHCSSTIEMIVVSDNKIILSNIQGNVTIEPQLFEDIAGKAVKHYDDVVDSLTKYSTLICED